MIGLEPALPLVAQVIVEKGLLDWAGEARVMSTNPARIADSTGSAARPRPSRGQRGHLTLVNPAARRFSTGGLDTQERNTPFLGQSVSGRYMKTLLLGVAIVFEGKLV